LSVFQASTSGGNSGSVNSSISHNINGKWSSTVAKRNISRVQVFSIEHTTAKLGVLNHVGTSGTSHADTINAQEIRATVGVSLGHGGGSVVQGVGIGISTNTVLNTAVALFLTDTDVVAKNLININKYLLTKSVWEKGMRIQRQRQNDCNCMAL